MTTYSDSVAWANGQQPSEGEPLVVGGAPIDYTVISTMQSNIQDLAYLDNVECAETYNSDLISKWRNVLLVSNATENSSILNIFSHSLTVSNPMPWLCGSHLTTNVTNPVCNQQHLSDSYWPMAYSKAQSLGALPSCLEGDPDTIYCATDPVNSTWNGSDPVSAGGKVDSNDTASSGDNYYTFPVQNSTLAFIQYCLAEKATEQCMVSFNVQVMLAVIICNISKVVSLLLLLLLPEFRPIGRSPFVYCFPTHQDTITSLNDLGNSAKNDLFVVTIGDAISSFLEVRDPYTAHHRLAPASFNLDSHDQLSTAWKLRRHRWFSGATVRQWFPGYLS